MAIVASVGGNSPLLAVREREAGFVVARWGEITPVRVYFFPNRALAGFETFLGTLEEAAGRSTPAPVLVMGDFNAKSAAWGSQVTNARGPALEDWAVALGVNVLNRGRAST